MSDNNYNDYLALNLSGDEAMDNIGSNRDRALQEDALGEEINLL